jgi:hypothetical protein
MILIPPSVQNLYPPAGSVRPLSDLTFCTPTKSNLYFKSFRKCHEQICSVQTLQIFGNKRAQKYLFNLYKVGGEVTD